MDFFHLAQRWALALLFAPEREKKGRKSKGKGRALQAKASGSTSTPYQLEYAT